MEIKSKLIMGMLAVVLRQLIRKKTGTDVMLEIHNVDIYDMDEKRVCVHLDLDGYIDKSELQKLVNNGLKNI